MYTTITKKSGVIALLVIMVLWAMPTYAHKIPALCTGSALGINLWVSTNQAHVGDTIVFDVDVFNRLNPGQIVCDATNIQASIVTPDGQTHPISLRRTALSQGEVDTYMNAASYVVRAQDVGTLTASASDTGTIHQNDTDSGPGGGFQGVNITVLAAPVVTPTLTPSPTPTPPVTPPSGGGSNSSGLPPATPILVATTTVATTTPVVTVSVVQVIAPPVITPYFPEAGLAPETTCFVE